MTDREQRLADEAIYLGEDRYEKPKEVFRRLGDMIEAEARTPPQALLDVGCATGELIHYLAQRFPGFQCTGIDIVPSLIERAKERVPGADFAVGSILDEVPFAARAYDIVVCAGVISIFDDVAAPVGNLLSAVREGGTLYLTSSFNDDAVDVRTRFRPSDETEGPWQSGWNIHSKATVERLLAETGHELDWTWEPLPMPFALDKGDDPMRTWTIETADDPFQRVNGACQLLNVSALRVRLVKARSGNADG